MNRNTGLVKRNLPCLRLSLAAGQPGISPEKVHPRRSRHQHAIPGCFFLQELWNRLLRILFQLEIKSANIKSIQILPVVVAVAISISWEIFVGPSVKVVI